MSNKNVGSSCVQRTWFTVYTNSSVQKIIGNLIIYLFWMKFWISCHGKHCSLKWVMVINIVSELVHGNIKPNKGDRHVFTANWHN
jgi:hypothetical protein